VANSIEINLGLTCNYRCAFCPSSTASRAHRGWSEPAKVRAEIDRLSQQGTDSISFSGGEPTLFPQLPDLIQHARDLGFSKITITTNGSRLGDPGFLDSLLQQGLTKVNLSIHSHSARLEDAITGRKGSFAQKISAIRTLVAAHQSGQLPELFLATVLHRKLLPHLETFLKFFHDLGIRFMGFNLIRPSADRPNSRSWVPSFEELTPRLRQSIAFNESRIGMNFAIIDIPLCKFPWEILSQPLLRKRYVGEAF
jgi:MoaA/NifB/PqqE/SkfB family radical SAM enzyme